MDKQEKICEVYMNNDKKSLIQSVSFTMGYSDEDIEEEQERKKNETLEFYKALKVDSSKLAGFNKLIGS